MRTALTGVVLVVVVLAGCGAGPTASPSPPEGTDTPDSSAYLSPEPTTTPTDGSSATVVVDGDLPVEAGAVWERFVALRNVSVAENVTLRVEVRRPPRDEVRVPPRVRDVGFARRLGVGPSVLNISDGPVVGGRTSGFTVTLFVPAGADEASIEATLVHEFEHVVQNARQGVVRGTVDSAVREGAATYVASRYAERYGLAVDPLAEAARSYRNAAGDERYWRGLYYHGARHVAARVDDAAAVSTVYDDPPTTFEQVLHPDVTEGPVPLSVSVDGQQTLRDDRTRMGELFVRVALSGVVGERRAASAAAGWGADQVVSVDGPDGSPAGQAWVVRTDGPDERPALVSALRATLDERARRTAGGSWARNETMYRLLTPGPDVVVLLVGDETFVDNSTVTADGGEVAVRPPWFR